VGTSEGKKEWELWADEAFDFSSEQDWALSNVKAVFTGEDGVFFTVTGEEGFVEPDSKNMKIKGNVITRSSNGYVFRTETVSYTSFNRILQSPGPVRVTGPRDKNGDSLKMSGIGMETNMATSTMEILDKVKARKAVKGEKVARIRSNRAVMSGKRRMATFHGNVIIDMDDMRITGPDAEFVYDKSNKLVESMYVKNGVKVSDALKYATSENVKVLFKEEKFVFRGAPRVVQNNDELTGEEIVFLNGGKRVKVQKVRARVEEESVKKGPQK
ncbi:MAG: LPS export ABC transporter periplasmic protein LptC, partial [Pseudomonadota bacterium]